MGVKLKRILKFGWQGFMRNKGLGLQVIFIISVAVFVWTSFFFFNAIGGEAIKAVQKKIDIAVYFKKDIGEQDIFEVRDQLKGLANQIESVEYVSRDKAMENFLQDHKDDPFYIKALEEVEGNPFLASLNIKAKEPGQYAQISSFLEGGSFNGLIEKISYNKNKQVIDRVFSATGAIKTIGIALGFLLSLLVILITFNTIKLSIFSSKDEIATMRLVGASNWFIRGPFLAQTFIFGMFAIAFVNIIFLSGFIFFGHRLSVWFFGLDFLGYFSQNIAGLLVVQVFSAVLASVFSTGLAVRKYLKV